MQFAEAMKERLESRIQAVAFAVYRRMEYI